MVPDLGGRRLLADLHVHTGLAAGRPVKVTASRRLTVESALSRAQGAQGLDAVGLADAAALPVLETLADLAGQGQLLPAPGGGLLWEGGGDGGGGRGRGRGRAQGRGRPLLVIPGSEVELLVLGQPVHFLVLLPDLLATAAFGRYLSRHQRRPELGCQRAHGVDPGQLKGVVAGLGGLVGLAHAFTPHRGFYGSTGATWLGGLGLPPSACLDFVEMGLSADLAMAGLVTELDGMALISSSDAHGPDAIGRESTLLWTQGRSWAELRLALRGAGGRRVDAWFGLDPRLGKYHRTACRRCGWMAGPVIAASGPAPGPPACPRCGEVGGLATGVLDLVMGLAGGPPAGERAEAGRPAGRGRGGQDGPGPGPGYVHQVPLLMLPGIGPATARRLRQALGGEHQVLHHAGLDAIAAVAGPQVARTIGAQRQGRLEVSPGGGGVMGRARRPQPPGP